jgi:hypothetical protein
MSENMRVLTSRGREQVVKLQLEAGADVNAQGGKYGSALRAALSQDGKQAVKLLFRTDIDFTQDYKWENDEHRVAASECHERIVKLLREAGAIEDPEQPDKDA